MPANYIVAMQQHIEEDESIIEAKLVMAREVAAYARSIAPVDEGDYRDGIQVQHVGASGVAVAYGLEVGVPRVRDGHPVWCAAHT